MSGPAVFEQLVAFADRTSQINRAMAITQEDYEQWRHDYIWEALHGIRYGQSFCNHFGINDNNLYYNIGTVDCADAYIKKTYLART
jgi:hypothetical protein